MVDAGAGFMFSGVATRLIQTWFPTKLEKAQTRSALEMLELNQRRLEFDMERTQVEREERREALLLQFEHQERLQAIGIDANRDLELERQSLARWPLDILPDDIIRASRARHAARQSLSTAPPLNLIFKLTSVIGQGSAAEQTAERQTQSTLMASMSRLRGRMGHYFHNDLIVHTSDVNAAGGMRWHRGDSLSSALYSRLWSEPVALVELFVDRPGVPGAAQAQGTPSRIGISISHWGWSGASANGAFESEGVLYFETALGSEADLQHLDNSLLAISTALRDTYATLTSLERPTPLTMFRVLPELEGVRFSRYVEGSRRGAIDAKTLLNASHRGMIEGVVAERAPAFAIEAAAQASLDAAAVGDEDAAKSYLDLAIEQARASISDAPKSEVTFLQHLFRADVNNRLPALRRAAAARLPKPSKKRTSPRKPPTTTGSLRSASRRFAPPKK